MPHGASLSQHTREDQRPRMAHEGVPENLAIHQHEVTSSTHSISGGSEGLVVPALTPVAEGHQDTAESLAEAVKEGAAVLSSEGQDEQAAAGVDMKIDLGKGGEDAVGVGAHGLMETPGQGKQERSGSVSGGPVSMGAEHGLEDTKQKALDNSFVGYDFNTVRKVGSVPPLPALRASRSTESSR